LFSKGWAQNLQENCAGTKSNKNNYGQREHKKYKCYFPTGSSSQLHTNHNNNNINRTITTIDKTTMARQGRRQQRGGRFGVGRDSGGRWMAGRGGGRQGLTAARTLQQQQQQQQLRQAIPSYLTYYNQYVSFKITSCLTNEERKVLGEAYPKFKPRELTPEQKKALEERRKKVIEAKKNQVCIADMLTEKTPEEEEEKKDSPMQGTAEEKEERLNDDDADNDDIVKAEEGEELPTPVNVSATSVNDNDDNDNHADHTNEDGESPIALQQQHQMTAQQKATQEAQLSANMTDCHTLLARLNTKRLYRRIRFLKKRDGNDNNDNFDINKVYPFHKTTEQIAIYEWQKLLMEFKQTQIQKLKEQERLAEEAARLVLEEEEREKEAKSSNNSSGGGSGRKTKKDPKKSLVDEKKVDDHNESKVDAAVVEAQKLPLPLPSKCELLLFSPCPRAVAVLASYPRSGNSLLRTLYERTSLRVTGSDMRGGLQKHDLVGEAATQTNCVQFVKTHYPERMGTPPFRVNRAVLLVRNPYDALESYFNLMTTNTHTTSLSAEERKKHQKVFAEMAKKEILVWRDFHEYWLQQNIPLLVIRYEDLIRYTEKVIAKVLRFVLEVNDMKFFEDRIDRAIREEQIEKLGSYKPRSGGIGKSLTKGVYSPELLQEINVGILSTMAKFGYDEMLVPNPSEWKLEPLDQLGVYIPGTAQQPLVINQKGLVRGPKRQTNWRAVKDQMQMKEQKCTCYKCIRGTR
jgi:hypothetical protein